MIINQIVAGSGGGQDGAYQEFEVVDGKLTNVIHPIQIKTPCVMDSDSVNFSSRFYNYNTVKGEADMSGLTSVSKDNAFNYTYSTDSLVTGAGITSVNLHNLTTVSGELAFSETFAGHTTLTSVDLSNLTTISGKSAFQNTFTNCTGLTSANLSALTTVSGNNACRLMFYGCTGLTSIYLPKITTSPSLPQREPLMPNMFSNSGLQIGDLRNLKTVGDYGILDNLFANTQYLVQVNLNALEHIGTEGARALFWISSGSSSTLTDVYFPMLTTFGNNPFYTNALTGREGLTIHFRKDAQATVEALANYSTMWGAGTGSSVVFDLAGTLTGADSNSYTRSEIDSVYASETAGAAKTATAWKHNNVVYYTSGGSEPSVSDAIYSDAACTQSVTTITAIA